MAVSTGAIIEHLDVIVDLRLGNIPSLVDSLLDPLLLQTAEERFRDGVIPAVAAAAHARLEVVGLAEA